MKIFSIAVFLIVILTVSGVCEVPAALGRITPLEGVPCIKADPDIMITKTTEIKIDDVIITGDGVKAKVDFIDGSYFNIQPNAKITFKSESIHINRGNVFIKLIKRGKTFKVYTPTATIGVYGTSFAVMLDDIASTVVALYTGKVQVGGTTGSMKSTILNAGQMTKVDLSGIPSSPQPIKEAILKYWKEFDSFLKKNKKMVNPLIKMLKKNDPSEIKDETGVLENPDIKEIVKNGVDPVISAVSKYGDLDGDGKVTLKDRAILYEYLNKNGRLTDQQKSYADVNGDGNIDKVDLNLIKLVAENSGDLNKDGYADSTDIQLMEDLIVAGQFDKVYDLDGNDKVDQYDLNLLRYFVKERETYIGR